MHVCLLWEYALSGRGLCLGLITCPEESYQVWCVWVWSWSLDSEEALAHYGLSSHGEIQVLEGNVRLHTAVKDMTSTCTSLVSHCWIYSTNFCDGLWPSWEVLLVSTAISMTQRRFPESPSHSLVQKFPVCYKIRRFLSYSRKPATMSDSDPDETVSYSHPDNIQACYSVFSSTVVIFLLRTNPNVRLCWVFCKIFLCQVLSLTCSKPKVDYHPLSAIRYDYWTYAFGFHPPFLRSASSGSVIPLWQVTAWAYNNKSGQPVSSQNSSILGRHVSKNIKIFLNVSGLINEGISLYIIVLCVLLNCAVQKWERTAECTSLRYDIWKVHFVNYIACGKLG